MYVRTTRTAAKKRITIELPLDQYEFLRGQADVEETTLSGLLRKLIDSYRSAVPEQARKNYKADSFYSRRGSFDGPFNLAEKHDAYLYGEEDSE